MKTVKILLLAAVLLAVPVLSVTASSPYYSYTYSYHSDGSISDIAAPLPYLPEQVYSSIALGVELRNPEDLVVDATAEHFYIVDSGTNAVYCFDTSFTLQKGRPRPSPHLPAFSWIGITGCTWRIPTTAGWWSWTRPVPSCRPSSSRTARC